MNKSYLFYIDSILNLFPKDFPEENKQKILNLIDQISALHNEETKKLLKEINTLETYITDQGLLNY